MGMTKAEVAAMLKGQVPELAGVPPAQLDWLAEQGTLETYADGAKNFSRGEEIVALTVVLQGGLSIFIPQAGGVKHLGVFEKGEITGLLPYSRMKAAVGDAYAAGETVLLRLPREKFPEMIASQPELTTALVHVMMDRIRDFTRQQQQDDKIMALGKLSAGLAHELNNPSAAVVRNAHELKRHFSMGPERLKAVIKICVSDEVVDHVNGLVLFKARHGNAHGLSMMARSEREDALADWLERNGLAPSADAAATFADFDFIEEDLESLRSLLRPADIPPVIQWMNQVLITERLVNEIQEASRRINTLVSSIKSYTHMDQAPVKERVDIHAGIQTTLTLLNHKVKHNQIQLKLEFEEGLPAANIFVGPMNQVWTNLIDNAVDAMEGRTGNILEIRTQRSRESILVYIIDNGPGIPADIQDKIFEPFFTTKPVGKGTGMGLEVVRQIITQHAGRLEMKSVPGRTEFSICFPIG